mmetsp:Transcript_3184/g.6007  ORF Transcript_3184/g.6007 Transcript_3184/m.6007 type:complete len:85 (-) Transcript_3184:1307-1561(-)
MVQAKSCTLLRLLSSWVNTKQVSAKWMITKLESTKRVITKRVGTKPTPITAPLMMTSSTIAAAMNTTANAEAHARVRTWSLPML